MRPYLLRILLAIFLPLSLFILPTRHLWQMFDSSIYTWCNTSVAYHPIQRVFWAFANIKITDLFGAFFLGGCFFIYIREVDGYERRKRVAHLLYALVWFEITILLSKQCLNPILDHLRLWRRSPSLVLSDGFALSKLVSWRKIKDHAYSSFPGDHATIVFLWCSFLWFFAGRARGLLAFCCCPLFLLPRVISGAHWASDIVVGSAAIVILAMTVATYPPLLNWALNKLYRCLKYTPEDSYAHISRDR